MFSLVPRYFRWAPFMLHAWYPVKVRRHVKMYSDQLRRPKACSVPRDTCKHKKKHAVYLPTSDYETTREREKEKNEKKTEEKKTQSLRWDCIYLSPFANTQRTPLNTTHLAIHFN